jgi:KaiC/GvpD/RAD55 family RecA-like ATPase
MSCSTGDETFDEMLAGGVPAGRTLLVRGPAGVGKSRLGAQFLRTGLAEGETCLYVTTDQPRRVAAGALDLPEQPGLTVAAVDPHAGEGGVRFTTGESEHAVSFRTLVDELSEPEWDRVVVDGAAGLTDLAPDAEVGRQGLHVLVERLDDHEATCLLTATPDDHRGVDRVVHGIVDCWRAEVAGDELTYVQVRKLRGRDHDTRRHVLAHEADGVHVARREAASTVDTVATGIPEFDALAGGFVRGGTTVFTHEGATDHWPFTAALCVRAIEAGQTVVLTTAPGHLRSRVADLLEPRVGPVRELMAADRLYLIDPVSRAPDEPVLADFPRENVVLEAETGSVQEAIRTLVGELGGEEVVAVLEHAALQHLVSPDQARQLLYWAAGNVLELEEGLTLTLTVDPEASGEQLASFFAGAADQVVRTWQADDGLQYLSVPRSASGSPGYTRVVEPIADPPYVRLR